MKTPFNKEFHTNYYYVISLYHKQTWYVYLHIKNCLERQINLKGAIKICFYFFLAWFHSRFLISNRLVGYSMYVNIVYCEVLNLRKSCILLSPDQRATHRPTYQTRFRDIHSTTPAGPTSHDPCPRLIHRSPITQISFSTPHSYYNSINKNCCVSWFKQN